MNVRVSVVITFLGLLSFLLVMIFNMSADSVNSYANRAAPAFQSYNHKHDKEKRTTDHVSQVSLQDDRRNMPENRFKMYDNVETFVMFIGHGRSGHSIVGSLLDAHPDVIIAHEYNILGNMKSFRKQNANRKIQKYLLFYRLEKNSEYNAMFGIHAQNSLRGDGKFSYTYHVPGQWQGTYRNTIKVIGDKKGGATSGHLMKEGKMADLEEIGAIAGVPMRFIHIIRNPFDNIATALLRAVGARDIAPGEKVSNEKRLNDSIKKHFGQTAANEKVRQKYGDAVIDLSNRGFVLTPKKSLLELCEFLGIICEDEYLEACASILHSTPSFTRNKVVWTDEQKRWVQQEIQKYSFLKKYNFDSP